MINMSVIVDKKDITKYIIKAILIILVLFVANEVVSLKQPTKSLFNLFNFIDKERLVSCIDENLHIAKLINNSKIDEKNGNMEPLKEIINSQFGMITSLKKIKNQDNNIVENETIANESTKIEKAEVGIETKVIENNVPENFTNNYDTVQIKNSTEYTLTEEILTPNIEINNKNIIIFHTHTCESYTPSERFDYEETGTYRTTDLNFSVARVGDELEEQLNSYGFNVIHDKTYHDYPAYNGSYGRSQETVENILNNSPDYDIIIDIHRDAIGDYTYAPTVKIGNDYASQLMFVMGTDGGGLEHPNWQQNLKFAIKVQEKANELYPRFI